MGFAPEKQVRTGLPAGGKEIRTLGPPEAIYTELVFKTLFTRWKTRNTDPFRGAASAVDCRGTGGGYQRPAAASSQGMTVTSGQIACARHALALCATALSSARLGRTTMAKTSSRPNGAAKSSLSSSSSRTPTACTTEAYRSSAASAEDSRG